MCSPLPSNKNQRYMKRKLLLLLAAAAWILSCDNTEEPPGVQLGDISGVPFTDVHFTDGFWFPLMEVNRTVSIPSAFHQCEINGRFDNFALAGGLIKGEHKGDFSFDDTDPYKVIEGASYSLAVKYDPKLDAYLDSVIVLIAAAQEPDGYLTTCVTNNCTRLSGWWGSSRWEKINSHELYNSGHLYEAAVAHYQATGKRTLLDVALKNADLVCRIFGPDEGQKHVPSGHPIVEMALVKLYGVTGDGKYLDMARYFVDETGRGTDGHRLSPYSQDHIPIPEQDEIVGHAVRAGYLYSGVTDVAAIQHDHQLFHAVNRVWDNMVGRKLYITGGIGSRAQGEGFGPDYELNNFNNYCETCASIANVYWNQRMFLATGESKYIDVLERTLYNGLIAGVSLSGDRFFYGNPLAADGGFERAPWFGCACCPGNITRFMASVPGYAYAVNKKDIFLNLFVEGNAKIKTDGNEVELVQKTNYPWEGDVEIEVNPYQAGRFTVLVRIPGWARNRPVPSGLYRYVDGAKPKVKIAVNGQDAGKTVRGGYAALEREWKAGDKITVHIDMPVRRVQAHKEVGYDEGLLAMERGPIVYALESIDQHKEYLFDVVIPRGSRIESRFDKNLLGGVIVLEGDAYTVEKDTTGGNTAEQPFTFRAVPYSVWNNRGPGQLVVWTPETSQYAIPEAGPTLASGARQVGGWGFNDRFEPKSSADINTPYHYWWLKEGTEESIGYRFREPQEVSSTEVYWLAFDHYDVIYKVPESWKLLYKKGDTWEEVMNASPYGTEKDMYNKVTFDPVTTAELKMVVQLQRPNDKKATDENGPQVVDVGRRGYSGGVIEWKIN